METLAAIGLAISLLNGIALIWLARSNTSAQDREKLEIRIRQLEHDATTVDQRIMVACHARVKRAGEYWEFHNKVTDFMEAVIKTGILK